MREIQFREALREAMQEEMRKDNRIYLMGEEVAQYNGAYKVSQGMLDEFGPERVIDTPIAELGFAGIGVGSAMMGLRPIVEFMTWNFSLVAIDQVVNNAAKMLQMSGGQYSVPIVFRGPSQSAGQLAATHSQSFESFYANVPGLKVVSCATPADGKGLLKSAIVDPNPVLVMESEQMYGMKGEVPEGEDFYIPLGKADIKREGKDVTLITYGKMYHVCLETANTLAKDGIDVEIIDLRSLRPIDYDTLIASIKKTNRAVVVDEAPPQCSIASEVAYILQRHAFDYLDAPVVKVNGLDTPIPYSGVFVDYYLPSPKRIAEAINYVMYK